MQRNKYASDYKVYMNENVKDDEEKLSSTSKIKHYQNTINKKPLISDSWIKPLGLNPTHGYDSLRNIDSTHQTLTLVEFAYELKLPVEILIEQFTKAGIPNLNSQIIISETDKTALLNYLRNENTTFSSNKINLTRAEVKKKRVVVDKNLLVGPLAADPLYQSNNPSTETRILLEDINDEFMYFVANDPLRIYQLGHRKFEEFVAKLFADRGLEVNLTKSTRDGGYDIFAKVKNSFSEFIILAECKKYGPDNKVGVEIVRSLHGVVEEHKANQGIIITSSFFTKEAQQTQLRIGSRMALKDYNDLVEWIKPYSK